MRETLLPLFFIALIELLGDSCFKAYAIDKTRTEMYILGMVAYFIMINGLIEVWSKDKLAVTNVIWNCYSTALDGASGIVLFGETLKQEEIFGAVLSLAGIIEMGQCDASLK